MNILTLRSYHCSSLWTVFKIIISSGSTFSYFNTPLIVNFDMSATLTNQSQFESSSSLSYSLTTKSLSPLNTSGCFNFICWFKEPSDLPNTVYTRNSWCNPRSGTCSVWQCPRPNALPYASSRRSARCSPPTVPQLSSDSYHCYFKFLQF